MHKRTFDREFKLQVSRQLVTGQKRLSQLCREHNLCASLVRSWRQQYESQGEEAWLDRESPLDQSQTRAKPRALPPWKRLWGGPT